MYPPPFHPAGYVPTRAIKIGETAFHEEILELLGQRRNPVCRAVFSLSTFATLRMTRMVFDYQILFGVLQWLPVEERKDFEVLLQTLVRLEVEPNPHPADRNCLPLPLTGFPCFPSAALLG